MLAVKNQRQGAKGLLNPWEFGQGIRWEQPIALASGEMTNRAELAFTDLLLVRLQARRNKEGVLEIFDEEKKN